MGEAVSPAVAIQAVMQGSLLSWILSPSLTKPPERFHHRCPVAGGWHYPQHDYNSPTVNDDLIVQKFLEGLEMDEDAYSDSAKEEKRDQHVHYRSHQGEEFNFHNTRQNKRLRQGTSSQQHQSRHRDYGYEDEIDMDDEKQHSTLLIHAIQDTSSTMPWTYTINIFTKGDIYYGEYHSANPDATSLALKLHKAEDLEDTINFRSVFALISCANIDDQNRIFVVLLPRRKQEAHPLFLELFPVSRDTDRMEGSIVNDASVPGGLLKLIDIDDLILNKLTIPSSKPTSIQKLSKAKVMDLLKEKKLINERTSSSSATVAEKKLLMNLDLENVTSKITDELSARNTIGHSSSEHKNQSVVGRVKQSSLGSNSHVLSDTNALTASCCNKPIRIAAQNESHSSLPSNLESPEDDKPQVKVYQSTKQPNTTITKIKSKPAADGSTKVKTIQDTQLPDGNKTKTKTIIMLPDGEEKTKKKTIVATPNKNATKVAEVKIGKHSVSQKTQLNVVKSTAKGNEQKNIVEKMKESPGRKEFELREQKQFLGPNKQKVMNKKQKEESSSKVTENKSEKKNKFVEESSSFSESTSGSDPDERLPEVTQIQKSDKLKLEQQPRVSHTPPPLGRKAITNSQFHQAEPKTHLPHETEIEEVIKEMKSSESLSESSITTDVQPPRQDLSNNSNFTSKVIKPVKTLLSEVFHPRKYQNNQKNQTDFIRNPTAPQNVFFETNTTKAIDATKKGNNPKQFKAPKGTSTKDYGHYLARLSACQVEGEDSRACRKQRRILQHRAVFKW